MILQFDHDAGSLILVGSGNVYAPTTSPSGKLGSPATPVAVQLFSVSNAVGTLVARRGALKLGFKPTGQYDAAAWDAYTDTLVPAGTTGDDLLTYVGSLALTATALYALFADDGGGKSPDYVDIMGALLDGTVELATFTFRVYNSLFRGPEVPPNPALGMDVYPLSSEVKKGLALAAGSYRDNAAVATAAVDGAIAGQAFSFTNLAGTGPANLFSTYDGANKLFVRNPQAWTADLDLSAVSVWNSANADGTGGNRGDVILIALQGTLAQAITNQHFAQPYQVGVRHYFMGTDGQEVYADVVAGGGTVTPAGGQATDGQVVYLQFPAAPTHLTPARLFAPGFAAGAFPVGTPVLGFNQEKQAVVREFNGQAGGVLSTRTALASQRVAYTADVVPGDSDGPVFLVQPGTATLLTSYTSSFGAVASGPDYSAYLDAINALLPAGCSVGVVTPPALGAGATRPVTPDPGPLVALNAAGYIDGLYMPPGFGGGAQLEQTWDGTGNVQVNAATTILRLVPVAPATTPTLSAVRTVTLAAAPSVGARFRFIIPPFLGSGGINVSPPSGGSAYGFAQAFGGEVLEWIAGGDGNWRIDNTVARTGVGTSPTFGGVLISGPNAFLGLPRGTSVYADSHNPYPFCLFGNDGNSQFFPVALTAGQSARLNAGGTALEAFVPGERVPVPASSTAPGRAGQWASDDNYLYVYGTTGWRRVAADTF